MTLIVNGEPKDCPDGISLAQFIASLQLKADRVAVELNRQIAVRNRWSEMLLKDGDRLEIVHFVGGGSASVKPQWSQPRQPEHGQDNGCACNRQSHLQVFQKLNW